MNELAITETARHRWTWRRIAVVLLLLPAIFVSAVFFIPPNVSRAKATKLYESLTPGMPKSEVHKVLIDAGLPEPQHEGYLAGFDDRFLIFCKFDENGRLCLKTVCERDGYPRQHELFFQRIGIPVGKLFLHWP